MLFLYFYTGLSNLKSSYNLFVSKFFSKPTELQDTRENAIHEQRNGQPHISLRFRYV